MNSPSGQPDWHARSGSTAINSLGPQQHGLQDPAKTQWNQGKEGSYGIPGAATSCSCRSRADLMRCVFHLGGRPRSSMCWSSVTAAEQGLMPSVRMRDACLGMLFPYHPAGRGFAESQDVYTADSLSLDLSKSLHARQAVFYLSMLVVPWTWTC